MWLKKPYKYAPSAAVLKLSRPLPSGDECRPDASRRLVDAFYAIRAQRHFVVVNADDLREEGHDVSRRLSWERSLADLARFGAGDHYRRLTGDGKAVLLVRLGIEGTAILFDGRADLVCETARIEGDTDVEADDRMPGTTSAFVAGLVGQLAIAEPTEGEPAGIALAAGRLSLAAVEFAMDVAERLRRNGFRMEPIDRHGDRESGKGKGSGAKDTDPFARPVALSIPFDQLPRVRRDGSVTRPDGSRPTERSLFRMECSGNAGPRFLTPLRGAGVVPPASEPSALAELVVRNGERTLAPFVHARFGKMLLAGWREIEAYRFVVNLIRKYLAGDHRRPLSLAVFGPPGAGKSFGFKEIGEMLNARGSKPRIEPLEFNLAQWTRASDLIAALHLIRDRAIAGRMPLVFFDEFDSAFEGRLGWLKLFLAPMQDGLFRDQQQVHAIGRAIFVFAGGTSRSFDEFRDGGSERAGETGAEFRAAKGPDFISRLSGHVDVAGIDRPETAGGDESAWLLRRAIILRRQIEEQFPGILDADGSADIDGSVLAALLQVPRFEHGVRSMEAILRMSSADRRSTRFGEADLPPDGQLRLHVDPIEFGRLRNAPPRRRGE